MSAPTFNILTQTEITIDLSRPVMQILIAMIDNGCDAPGDVWDDSDQCELDNFRNTLLNLLERSEPETGNFDLVGG